MVKATPFSEATAVSTGTATRQSPNSDSTPAASGMDMLGMNHYVVTISADNGQVLTGAGNVLCWRRSDALGRWVRNPDLDFPITPVGGLAWVNMRDRSTIEYDLGVQFGRLLWAPSGVAVDGGTIVTTTIEATREF